MMVTQKIPDKVKKSHRSDMSRPNEIIIENEMILSNSKKQYKQHAIDCIYALNTQLLQVIRPEVGYFNVLLSDCVCVWRLLVGC